MLKLKNWWLNPVKAASPLESEIAYADDFDYTHTVLTVPDTPKESEKPPKFNKTPNAYINALKRRGFEFLGSGAYACVYAKPGSDKVIKIGRRPRDDGWFDYIDWAKRHGWMGKFAPVVYSYKYHKGTGSWENGKYTHTDFYVAVIERLEKGADKKRLAGILLQHKALYPKSMLADYMLERADPGLATFTNDFLSEFNDYASVDLHGGNYMERKNGDFVLTDPLCSPKIIYKKRMKAEAGAKPANAA